MAVHVYNGSVAAGNTSGTIVAEGLETTNKVTIRVNRGAVSAGVAHAIRTSSGVAYNVAVTPINEGYEKWELSKDGVNFSPYLVWDSLSSVNEIFYIRCSADSDETYGDNAVVVLVLSYYQAA